MRKLLSYVIILILIPLVIFGGSLIFKDKQYAWVSLCITALACVPFFTHFENKDNNIKKLVLISVMVALSVIGRIIFTPVPGFKPMTAIVVITAIYFGSEAGFMTGALSAFLSNFYFGQGPWTPFQMFIWGLIGLIAGLIAKPLKKNNFFLAIYGVVTGVMFSLLMDCWTVFWVDNSFNVPRYLATVISSLNFMVLYAVSNVVFLLLFTGTIRKILERIKTKYSI